MPSVSKELNDIEERHAVSSNSDDVGKDEKSDKLPVRSPTLSQHPRKIETVRLNYAAHLTTR
jgi:hypothetical protein